MEITLNGKCMQMPEALTVEKLLAQEKIESPDMVSVELNDEILEKEMFATVLLQENDTVEFLYFMGGGSGRYEKYRPKI